MRLCICMYLWSRCWMIRWQITLFPATPHWLPSSQTTASLMDPSWNRLSSDFSPQKERNSTASALSAGGPMFTMEKAWSVSNSNPKVTWPSLVGGGAFVGNHCVWTGGQFSSSSVSKTALHTFSSASGRTVNNLTLFSRPRCSTGIKFFRSSGRGHAASSNRIMCLVASSETIDGLKTLPGAILQHTHTHTHTLDHTCVVLL